ncbi:diphosphomevalonate decarboxylase [Pseudomonas sp. BJa5]|uniref:diphosphomevalonate decarboxylase n=1 Tax=Pseudomonas sp. BJa5 TaxID=2936270 RepID=UPI0025598AA5|nr:diphosphomevalonate decarboxylase [Pseudomonas sp. BGr12]MDL2419512.1 diphosphomevalonate decarboxylase [Pseudomonas sp. BGr12]
MNKISVSSPSNIALIKYWGMSDAKRTLPANRSLSMTLSRCVSLYTLETLDDSSPDEIYWRAEDGTLEAADPIMRLGIEQHVRRLRQCSDFRQPLRIATTNTFPTSAGIASSASGYSALALAFAALFGQLSSPDQLSGLARLSGSGSAARSLLGGFVTWPGDADDPQSPARQLATAAHWPLHDIIVVVDGSAKTTSSRIGHLRAQSSPFYQRRQQLLVERLRHLQHAILTRDFSRFADIVECEAIELHLIAMSSVPPLFYWQPATLSVLYRVQQLRRNGLDVCTTFDAGPNAHVLCTPEHCPKVLAVLRELDGVQQIIPDQIGEGPQVLTQALF